MVKAPNVRHSKPRRDPVTIDLKAETAPPASESPAAKPEGAPRPAAAPHVAQSAAAPIEDKPSTAFGRDAGKPETPRPTDQKPDAAASKPADAKPADPKPGSPTASSVPPRPAPQPERRGGMSAIAAGLIGGVVTLAGAGALQWGGVLPAPGQPAADTSALEAQVAQLKGQVEALPAPVDVSGRLDALAAELNDAKAQIAAGGSPSPEAAQALENRLKSLEAGLASAQGGGAPVDLAPVNERINAVETAAAAATKSATEAAAAASAVGERIGAIEKTVGELTGKVAEQAEQPKAALAIAASALKTAIDRGDPFTTEIDTFAAIAPAAPEIDALRAMAATGVPSQEAIKTAFPDAAAAMVAAGRTQDPNAGFFDKLVSSAQSLVQVRPVGMVEGEGAGETVARMEVHLNKGDYPAVAAEYDKLPEPAKAAGASFIAMVKARLAADRATDALLASALKA